MMDVLGCCWLNKVSAVVPVVLVRVWVRVVRSVVRGRRLRRVESHERNKEAEAAGYRFCELLDVLDLCCEMTMERVLELHDRWCVCVCARVWGGFCWSVLKQTTAMHHEVSPLSCVDRQRKCALLLSAVVATFVASNHALPCAALMLAASLEANAGVIIIVIANAVVFHIDVHHGAHTQTHPQEHQGGHFQRSWHRSDRLFHRFPVILMPSSWRAIAGPSWCFHRRHFHHRRLTSEDDFWCGQWRDLGLPQTS
mmetsp:Transcript_1840/g.5059  ORF Transcript_1840/g.5059 Transcript_1840/m.5059 type:complete len:253 (-) Transcript_1840:356-1114(-)